MDSLGFMRLPRSNPAFADPAKHTPQGVPEIPLYHLDVDICCKCYPPIPDRDLNHVLLAEDGSVSVGALDFLRRIYHDALQLHRDEISDKEHVAT